jgi:hypothetical protein
MITSGNQTERLDSKKVDEICERLTKVPGVESVMADAATWTLDIAYTGPIDKVMDIE